MTEKWVAPTTDDTDDEPGFVPNPIHPATYAETRREAWQIITQQPQSGEEAIAAAILALAAQVGRIADAVEFAMVNNY